MATHEDERVVDKRAASRMDGEPGDGEDEATPAEEAAYELEDTKAKADQYYKNWQRSAADFINYKRRIEQERGENARLASAALVINLLPIYDDMDRAVSTVDAQLAGLNWVQGIIAIQQKFTRLLEAMGVSEIPAAGQPFDPAYHEAVGQQQGQEGAVLHVVQKGYQLGDRVIRPAMVIVGDGTNPQQA